MDELAAIAVALEARVVTSPRGALLTFRRGDASYTISARANPHLELTMDAPDLRDVTLEIQLGAPTLLGAEGDGASSALDPHWRVRGDRHLLDLLAEPPWPWGITAPPSERSWLRSVGIALVGYVTYGMVDLGGANGTEPTPRFMLTVADGRATIERRSSELDGNLAIGAARRLLQLVTIRARRRAAAAAPRPLRPVRRGPYR